MEFGTYLRNYREILGISLRKFASRIGVSAAVLSGVERNERIVPKSFPLHLAAYELGIRPGTDDWNTYFDLASCGDIPADVRYALLRDKEWFDRIRAESAKKEIG